MYHKVTSSILPYNTHKGTEFYLNDKLLRLWSNLHGLSLLTLEKIPYYFIQQSKPAFHIHGQFYHSSESLTLETSHITLNTCYFTYHHFPFQKCSFDRIILFPSRNINLGNLSPILRSYWEILKDDGKILLLLPNKLKWWKIFNIVTLYQNRKHCFYQYQIKNILKEHMFQIIHYEKIVYFPPQLTNSLSLSGNRLLERIGHFFIPFGGEYHLIEIRKKLYAPITISPVEKNKFWQQNISRPNWNRKKL